MPNKSCLRTHYKTLRQNLASEQRSTHTKKITDHIRNLCSKSEWKNIACFASHGGEPDLSELLYFLQEMGTKRIGLARTQALIENLKYYDKYFATDIGNPQSPLFGVAFSAQRSEKILPVDELDVSLDGVITENGLASFTVLGGKYGS